MSEEKPAANNTELPEELMKHRGDERPRSLLDLIDQKMLDIDLAAHLVSLVSRDASLIVSSGPGGVGKSTTMRALLAFAPEKYAFSIAMPDAIAPAKKPSCAISLELSDHSPPGYLWDQDLRDFLALSTQGHMLVSNMHADELHEVHAQIVEANNVPVDQFRAINIFAFVTMEGLEPGSGRVKDTTSRRYFTKIYYSDGTGDHTLIYSDEEGLSNTASCDVEYRKQCKAFLEDLLKTEERTIEGIRREFLAWMKN